MNNYWSLSCVSVLCFCVLFQKLRGSQVSLLALALFRQITCRYKSHDTVRLPSQQVTHAWCLDSDLDLLPMLNIYVNLQETNRLEELLQGISLVDYRDFCAALLSNQIGGAGSSLHVDPGLSIQRQILLELLVHLGSVLLTGNPLLIPLKNIAFQPQTVTVSYILKGQSRILLRTWVLFMHVSPAKESLCVKVYFKVY